MVNQIIKPSLTLFSNKSPVCHRKSLGIGRVYTYKDNVLTEPKPIVIEDEHGNRFDCAGFSDIQRLQLNYLKGRVLGQPVVFSHNGLDDKKRPLNPVFLRLVPNEAQWKEGQLKRAFA